MLNQFRKKINDRLRSMNLAVALFLSIRFERLSIRGKKSILVAFCCLFGCATIFLAVQPVGRRQAGLAIQPIRLPAHAIQNGSPPTGSGTVIPPQVVQQISAFRHYIDSLRRDTGGARVYDSLVRARPGLLDSLSIVEQIIQSNKR
jgi:hypothetical protein